MPHRFARRWLAYDETRPTQPRFARKFILVLFAMLLVAGLLALATAQ